MLLDKISYRSFLKDINPLLKTFFALITLILLLSTNKKEIFIFNFIIFILIMLFCIKVRISELLKLYIVPAFFVLTTLISLIWTKNDVEVFIFRTFSSISVIYTLICSTPITDLDYVFYKLKFPKIFRELFLLIHNYIFILFDVKDKLLNSQKTRLGYVNYKSSINSFTMLVVSIFRKTSFFSVNATKAVESRLGTEFLFLHRTYKKVGIEIIFILMIFLINLFLVVKNYV